MISSGFLVDDTRLELVTSRTSTPGRNFFALFMVLFSGFCSVSFALQCYLTTAFPSVPNASVVCYVVKQEGASPPLVRPFLISEIKQGKFYYAVIIKGMSSFFAIALSQVFFHFRTERLGSEKQRIRIRNRANIEILIVAAVPNQRGIGNQLAVFSGQYFRF